MSDKNNFTILVDKQHVWNTSNAKVSLSSALLRDLIMLNLSPPFLFNVLFYSWCFCVDWESNDSNLISPKRFVLFKHFLVVLHRVLARATPCSPEIKKNDLALFVRYCFLSIFHALVQVLYWRHHVSYAYCFGNRDFYFNIFHGFLYLRRYFIKSLFIKSIWSFSFKSKTFTDLLLVVSTIIDTLVDIA